MNRLSRRLGLGWRIRQFLGSAGHLVGMLFAIGGIVLLNNGVTSGFIGLGLIVVLYLTGYFLAARPRVPAIAGRQTPDAANVGAGLDDVLRSIRRRVADDIYYRVASIRDAVVFTLQTAGDNGDIDPDIHMVRQTATKYLPEALSTYLALPSEYAEYERVDGARTSHDVLLDQLVLMDLKTRQVAEKVLRRSSQDLLTHGRFVADRFSDSALTVGDPLRAGQGLAERTAEPERSAERVPAR